MWSYAHEEEAKLSSNFCKFLAAALKDACIHCHCSCTRACLSFNDNEEIPAEDFDYKHVVILEIRSRAMKAKLRPKDYSMDNLSWIFSPTPEKLLVPSKGEKDGEDGAYKNGNGEDDEETTFFSVKSLFSHCSGESGIIVFKELPKRSVLEEFCHCEGWPFGLGRRKLMLPPLPSSPSDSWVWRKRNLSAKICSMSSWM